MKVTQEKLPASQIGLEIEIPSEISKQTYEKVVQTLARTANIPGFRKGKVPRQILMQRLGTERIKATTLEEILQTSLDAALKQEKVQAIGNYQVQPSFEELLKNYKPDQALTFKVAVDVPPTIVLPEYRNLSIKAEEIVYQEEQLEQFFLEKQSERATLIPIEDRPAQLNDTVIVDYQAYKLNSNGEKEETIEELKGLDSKVELIEGKLLSGMVEGIIGMKPEEVKDVTISFPGDYPRQELAGSQVIFTFSLKEIKTKELPELDDEFAQEISEYKTIEELKNVLREDFQKQAQENTRANIHQAIVEELGRITEIELPETYIEQEIKTILTQTAMQMEQYGLNVSTLFSEENIPRMRENARPEAIKKLKERLILEKIAETENIEVDPVTLIERIQEVKKELAGKPVDDQRLVAFLKEELRTTKTLDWLQESVQTELLPSGTEQPATTIDVEATTSESLEQIDVEATTSESLEQIDVEATTSESLEQIDVEATTSESLEAI